MELRVHRYQLSGRLLCSPFFELFLGLHLLFLLVQRNTYGTCCTVLEPGEKEGWRGILGNLRPAGHQSAKFPRIYLPCSNNDSDRIDHLQQADAERFLKDSPTVAKIPSALSLLPKYAFCTIKEVIWRVIYCGSMDFVNLDQVLLATGTDKKKMTLSTTSS